MKNIILISFFMLSNFSFGQNLVFTNQNLKELLINENCVDLDGDEFADSNIDLNNDGEIQISEANITENLVLGSNNYTVTSVYDLHQFTNLKRLTIWGGLGLIQVSNLNLSNLEHIRISDFNTITDIDLSDLPNLNSIYIEGLNGLNTLNIKNGSYASEYFSLFYTYFNFGCVDDIAEEYNLVALHLLNGAIPTTDCSLGIDEQQKEFVLIYPNPTSSEINIKTTLIISKASIYDMTGKMVHKSEVVDKTINGITLESGLYVLVLETANGAIYKHKITIK